MEVRESIQELQMPIHHRITRRKRYHLTEKAKYTYQTIAGWLAIGIIFSILIFGGLSLF